MKYSDKPTNQLKAVLILVALVVATVGGFIAYVTLFNPAVL